LQLEGDRIAKENAPGAILERSKHRLGAYYYLFCLMESSGCRFSEVASLTCEQISESGKWLVKGKKGSSNRFIDNKNCVEFLLKMKSIARAPFQGCNIFTASRHLISIGLITHKKGRERMTVTGIFRDNYARSIREVDNTSATVSKHLGHKVSKNGDYYGKD